MVVRAIRGWSVVEPGLYVVQPGLSWYIRVYPYFNLSTTCAVRGGTGVIPGKTVAVRGRSGVIRGRTGARPVLSVTTP